MYYIYKYKNEDGQLWRPKMSKEVAKKSPEISDFPKKFAKLQSEKPAKVAKKSAKDAKSGDDDEETIKKFMELNVIVD